MSKPIYTFNTQLQAGDEAELKVWKSYRARFDSDWREQKATVAVGGQKMGIDYFLYNPLLDSVLGVEIKSDMQAQNTGNVFLETISVSKARTPEKVDAFGWMVTSKADILLYAVPAAGYYFECKLPELRRFLTAHMDGFRLRECKNSEYSSFGFLVPTEELSRHFQKHPIN